MTGEIRRKPGGINAIELEFSEELVVRDDVETFAKIQETKQGDVAAVHVRKDAVCDGKKCGFCGVAAPETMLRLGKEVVVGEVCKQLALYQPFNGFGHDRNYGYGAVIGDEGRVT